GHHQDHPDRVADPAREAPARDAGRARPQQDAPHGGARGHAGSARRDPQGAAYGRGGGL
ncbi:MAG: LSU ribosomal protein L30p (L7e), partial [uncultured Sphingomonadaceae bacterium]